MNRGHILIAWTIYWLAKIVIHSAAAEWNEAQKTLNHMQDGIREGEMQL